MDQQGLKVCKENTILCCSLMITRMTWVTFLKEKSQAFEKFKIFKAMVENETHVKIKCLRLDNGGEFTSNEFNEFCEIHGIKIQFSAAKTPQQNGVVERKNRTVQEAARTMLNEERSCIHNYLHT